MHLEGSQLTEFWHLALFMGSLAWCTELVLHSLGGIDDWKSRWEIATKDEIPIGFDVPNVFFHKVALTAVEPLPVQLEHS